MRTARLSLLATALATIGIGACGSDPASKAEEQPLTTSITAPLPSTAVNGGCSERSISETAAFDLEPGSAAISGDALSVSIVGAGVCAEDTFYACWPGIFLDSDPPQAHVNLVRSATSGCSEHPTTVQVSIDLRPVRELYGQVNPTDAAGTVTVDIINPGKAGGGATQPYAF